MKLEFHSKVLQKMAKRVTMTDIARRAGVSQGTVSVVLNAVEGSRICAETRQRVRAAALDLGYDRGKIPPLPAAAQRLIGVIVADFAPHSASVAQLAGLQAAAKAEGCQLLIATPAMSEPDVEPVFAMAQCYQLMRRNGVSGVICLSAERQLLQVRKTAQHLPTIYLNCQPSDRQGIAVVPALRLAAQIATEAYLREGHRRIAHLAWAGGGLAAVERREGYRQAYLAADLALDPALACNLPEDPAAVLAHLQKWLSGPRPPTALLCDDADLAQAVTAIWSQMDGLGAMPPCSIFAPQAAIWVPRHIRYVVWPYAQMAQQALAYLLEGDVDASTAPLQMHKLAFEHPGLVAVQEIGRKRTSRSLSPKQ